MQVICMPDQWECVMFIMLQHLWVCIISHVGELDEHLDALKELCMFFSQKQY